MNKERKTLLFMYVDNFCGIEQESFNFDVRQRFCVKNSNTIVPASDEFKNFPTHFFGDNISALTLLIGENGAGKTTLFRLMSKWLCELAAGTYPQERGAFIICVGERNYLIAFQNGEEWAPNIAGCVVLEHASKEDAQVILEDVSLVYYTDTMTDLELDELLPENKREFLTDHSLIMRLSGALNRSNYLENAKDTMKRAEFAHQMKLFLHLGNTKAFPIHFMKFSSVKIGTSKCFEHLRSLGEDGDDMKSLLESYGERIAPKEADSPAMLTRCLLWGFLTGVVSSLLLWERRLFGMQKSRVLPFFKDAFRANLRHLKQSADTSELYIAIKQLLGNLSHSVAAFEDMLFENEFNKLWEECGYNKNTTLIDILRNAEERYLAKKTDFNWQESCSDDRIIYYIPLDKLPRDRWEEFWPLYEKFYHMIPDFCFAWHNVSSGEKNLGNLISMLTITDNGSLKEVHNTWCLWDEPNNTLHPQQERKFIQRLCALCSDGYNNYQLWISTHSPIMLSDVPKQAAIFLLPDNKTKQSDEKQGDNSPKKEGKKEQERPARSSFAQQIYTLYNDAFFLEEGVIGTFAEQHIRTVYKKLLDLETRLNSGRKLGKKKISEAKQTLDETKVIIDCLDEPLLKGHLQLMYKQCQRELNRREQNTNKL